MILYGNPGIGKTSIACAIAESINEKYRVLNATVNNKKDIEMKKDIHPSNYREVVFKDMSNGETFITRSTVAAKETIEIDGVTYPLVKLEITSSSHPFFTGKQKLVDTAGRVDKFMSRYGNRLKK